MASSLRLPYLAVAAASGALFGAGLYISQMVDPLKVLHFLDFTAIPEGKWDPSLALVMLAAVAVMAVGVRFGQSRSAPLFDTEFHEPEFKRIDSRLVGGSALFGIGWGMSGICPGPAVSLIAFWPEHLLVLLVAIFVGSLAGSLVVPSGHDRRLAAAR